MLDMQVFSDGSLTNNNKNSQLLDELADQILSNLDNISSITINANISSKDPNDNNAILSSAALYNNLSTELITRGVDASLIKPGSVGPIPIDQEQSSPSSIQINPKP